MASATGDEQLRTIVLAFSRDVLRRRYEIENVRRFRSFDNMGDQPITKMRELFLDPIYPPPEQRNQLDEAFDRLGEMLRSPSRMGPLMGAAFKSMWRLGHRLPTAINAGRSTIDAFSKTRHLEQLM